MNLEVRVLENAFARLEPLSDTHREALRIAANDARIWTWFPDHGDGERFDGFFSRYRSLSPPWISFAVRDATGDAVGMTSYINPTPEHGRVEIGGTWYGVAAQGGPVNPSAKLLLMSHAFASGAERVELKTDAFNARSRAAILKLGAQFEGIHRHHMRRRDGTWRDTAWYSVLSAEWPSVRAGLEKRLAAFA